MFFLLYKTEWQKKARYEAVTIKLYIWLPWLFTGVFMKKIKTYSGTNTDIVLRDSD